jgi:hypothetical protein
MKFADRPDRLYYFAQKATANPIVNPLSATDGLVTRFGTE